MRRTMINEGRNGGGCSKCELRGDQFCGLAEGALRKMDSITSAVEHANGDVVFVEGQQPCGVYVVCHGHVKLSTSSGDARVLITDIAGPGNVLGLSAAVSGRPYEVTAEALGNCRLSFIRRDDFLRLLEEHAGAARRVTRQLSRDYHTAHRQARLLGLSASAAGKLAGVLLAFCERAGRPTERGVSLKLALTHEEIGQLIGASRETVTRLFTDFKSRRIIQVKGATLFVRDLPALEALALP